MHSRKARKISFNYIGETCQDLRGVIDEVVGELIVDFAGGGMTITQLEAAIKDDLFERIPREITEPMRDAMVDAIEEISDEKEDLENKIYDLENQQ